jgi:uncharacterized protein
VTDTTPYRPAPHVNYLNEPFWQAARERRLVSQRCEDCGQWFAPADAACTSCFSTNWTWQESSGKGTLYSFSAMHRVLPGFPSPTILAVVELDEGFTVYTNIVECEESELRCDMPVEVVFEDYVAAPASPAERDAVHGLEHERPASDTYTLPLFRPVRG